MVISNTNMSSLCYDVALSSSQGFPTYHVFCASVTEIVLTCNFESKRKKYFDIFIKSNSYVIVGRKMLQMFALSVRNGMNKVISQLFI